MASSGFIPNRAGMAALLRSDIAKRAVEGPARRVEAAAKRNAPVKTGRTLRSIEMHIETRKRVRAVVSARVPYASRVEAERHWLARSLDAARGS